MQHETNISPQKARSSNRVVYVVMGWERRLTNDRVAKILRLRSSFARMQLVLRGPNQKDEQELSIRAIPNPLARLGKLKLHSLQFKLEQLMFFPNSPGALYDGGKTAPSRRSAR